MPARTLKIWKPSSQSIPKGPDPQPSPSSRFQGGKLGEMSNEFIRLPAVARKPS